MKEAFHIQGKFIVEIIRNGKVIEREEVPNVVTIEGKNYLMKLGISNQETSKSWYVGLIGANVTPSEADTASSALGTTGSYQEITAYSETTRPSYNASFSNNAVSNSSSPASFTISSSVTAYGAFITSTNTKQDNNGILLCASKFATAKNLDANDVINITYTISSVS